MKRPSIVVSVGTDHHAFDRLVAWVDRWAAEHPEADVFVQYGTAHPPKIAAGSSVVDPDDLWCRVRAATAVVVHGGLSSIMETRAHGFLPVVVARDPALSEHVDGHQQAFTKHEEALGRIRLARTEGELHAILDGALADPSSVRLAGPPPDVSAAVAAVAAIVDDLVRSRPARHRRKAAR